MSTFIVDDDPIGRMRSRIVHHGDGSLTVDNSQDAEPVLEDNKMRYNSVDERTRWNDFSNRVASIPLVVWWDLVKRGIADDEKALRKWLDDPENRHFRTRPGKLSR